MGFRFVDLFAGIGGFHAALSSLGGECVYAVEIDPKAAEVYNFNWRLNPLGDITEHVDESQVLVGEHEVLVAGFPCQPFSKSGAQRGMDETRGTLYWNILRIIQSRKPALVVLENVRNLAGPRHLHEWQVIISTLRAEGYEVSDTPAVFSPHLLPPSYGGRPQVRERVFIVAVRNDLDKSEFAMDSPVVENKPIAGWNPQEWNLFEHLPLEPSTSSPTCELTDAEKLWIDAWDDFVRGMWEEREGKRLPGFPLWADSWVHMNDLSIPDGTPTWKEDFLRKNSRFYTDHQEFIDNWLARWEIKSEKFPPSRRKLEWQAQDSPSLWSTVMHFRPSGIRAKRPTYLPALVAITQTSIIGPLKRRLSPREAARLQGLPDWFGFPGQSDAATYKQLGNGVNVGVVWHVIRSAVKSYRDLLTISCPQLVSAVDQSPENPDEVLCNPKLVKH